MRMMWLALAASLAGLAAGQTPAPASDAPGPHFVLPDPVGHAVDVHARPWSTEDAAEVTVVPVAPPAESGRTWVATNAAGTLRAYVAPVSNAVGSPYEHVYVEDLSSGTTYQVRNVPLGWRWYADLAWATDRYLIFDRWSTPHYGVHYVVDARERRLVHATPFPDGFCLSEQRKRSAKPGTPVAAGPAEAPPDTIDPEDDFAPGLLVMVLVFIVVCLVLVGIGIALGVAAVGIAAILLAVGALSTSVLVGFLRRRPGAAARALFLQFGGLGGAAAGAVLALAVRWLAEINVHWGWALAAGGLGGLAAGTAVALAFNFAWSRALDWLAARMKDPPRPPSEQPPG